MDTGIENRPENKEQGNCPDRYVSDTEFDKLPDRFQKLAELLSQDQFELVEEPGREDKENPYVNNRQIRLVYLMNDAIESFLVFGNAHMTGTYLPEYDGELLADLSRQGKEYILVVHQGDTVVTVFFETLELEMHLYDYSEIGHFWVKGYEYLRQIEYRLAILHDKYEYIGSDSCNPKEEKLAALADFPPLNHTCYPAVPEKYIVPKDNPWGPSAQAFTVMEELAERAGDRSFLRALKIYKRFPFKAAARRIAVMLHRKKHRKVVELLMKDMKKATENYRRRSFGEEADRRFRILEAVAEKEQEELKRRGIKSEILREEPFTIALDDLGFKVYLMIWKNRGRNITVEVKEIRDSK